MWGGVFNIPVFIRFTSCYVEKLKYYNYFLIIDCWTYKQTFSPNEHLKPLVSSHWSDDVQFSSTVFLFTKNKIKIN